MGAFAGLLVGAFVRKNKDMWRSEGSGEGCAYAHIRKPQAAPRGNFHSLVNRF